MRQDCGKTQRPEITRSIIPCLSLNYGQNPAPYLDSGRRACHNVEHAGHCNRDCEWGSAAIGQPEVLAGAGAGRRGRDERHPPRRPRRTPRACLRPREAAWIHRQPEVRDGSIPRAAAGCAAGGGGGRLAVQPSYSARTLYPQGSDPDGGQLERPVAGTGGDAEPERFDDQGRHHVQHVVERGFHGRVLPERPAQVAGRARRCNTM